MFCLSSLHPSLPLLATTSGQRIFALPDSDSDSGSDTECEHQTIENSLKIWSLLGPGTGKYNDVFEKLNVHEHDSV